MNKIGNKFGHAWAPANDWIFKSLLLGLLVILLNGCGDKTTSRDDTATQDDTTPPEITLLGANPIGITRAPDATFSDPGATAHDNVDGDISANIVVGGDTVDTATVGTYVLTYDVKDAAGNAASQVTRSVVVTDEITEDRDTTPPVITLLGANPLRLVLSQTSAFSDPGATALDNVDGDISANIMVSGDTVNSAVTGTYVVIYNVNDAAGNAAPEVRRTVVVGTDTTAPVITLQGASSLEVALSSDATSFIDPGATAIDDVDGDISANIVVGGDTVDTATTGAYVVTYDVTDAAGNAAEQVTRTVEVVESTSSDADACPENGLKTDPGICGCDVLDLDQDHNGVMDCQQATPVGWTDLSQYLVESDGSHSLGDHNSDFNATRDQGSKIVYFDSTSGDNATAEAYWWDGTHIVDSDGSTLNPDNSQAYGTDPLNPNEDAIRPFATLPSDNSDLRLVTQKRGAIDFSRLAGGYPDWFLFRRGQVHSGIEQKLVGGRSEAEPMVITGYGPLADGRAILEGGLGGSTGGGTSYWLHQVLASLEIRGQYGWFDSESAPSANDSGGPVTAYLEDCYFPSRTGGGIAYPPTQTDFRRTIVTGHWRPASDGAHVQGYFTHGFENRVSFDEVIFYKNGFLSDPLTDPDPIYDKFSRNIYEGGGAQMGHVYRNFISADGGSGGPQMRFGGWMENSLILEGYFYSSTNSNKAENEWLQNGNQSGQSALVRNNVQLIYGYPTPIDPDTDGRSDTSAQPGWGYTLQGASFGVVIEGNIISGAMLSDDLGGAAVRGLVLSVNPAIYADGNTYNQKNNTLRNNIIYRSDNGLQLLGSASGVSDIEISGNVFVADTPIDNRASDLNQAAQINVDNNRFYCSGSLPSGDWFGSGNSSSGYSNAASTEGWSDPDRSLKRYVTEVLGLTLLDWGDDPNLDATAKQARINAGEVYDPTGMKTFMAVAIHMRKGGTDTIPNNGKPNLNGDYPWDTRFTAQAVVNWIRAGFGLAEVD